MQQIMMYFPFVIFRKASITNCSLCVCVLVSGSHLLFSAKILILQHILNSS